MDVGIALPGHVSEGLTGEEVLEWARKADAGPFSSLASIDRLVYATYEPLIALAAATGATQRVRLMTTILLAPLRNASVLAKQVASLDAISGGRLTLGLGIGSRESDYRAAPASYKDRGRRFEEQLTLIRRIWSGEPVADGLGPVGPPPKQKGGPQILIGAGAPTALRRAGRWADGLVASPGTPDYVQQLYAIVEGAWQAEGRSGKPRLVTLAYYALGPGAVDRGAANVRQYYAFVGPRAERTVQLILTSPEEVKATLRDHSGVGADELVFLPTVPELEQVDRLAEIVG